MSAFKAIFFTLWCLASLVMGITILAAIVSQDLALIVQGTLLYGLFLPVNVILSWLLAAIFGDWSWFRKDPPGNRPRKRRH